MVVVCVDVFVIVVFGMINVVDIVFYVLVFVDSVLRNIGFDGGVCFGCIVFSVLSLMWSPLLRLYVVM